MVFIWFLRFIREVSDFGLDEVIFLCEKELLTILVSLLLLFFCEKIVYFEKNLNRKRHDIDVNLNTEINTQYFRSSNSNSSLIIIIK